MTDDYSVSDVCFVAWRVLFDPPVPSELSRSLAFWHLELQAGNQTAQQPGMLRTTQSYVATLARLNKNE